MLLHLLLHRLRRPRLRPDGPLPSSAPITLSVPAGSLHVLAGSVPGAATGGPPTRRRSCHRQERVARPPRGHQDGTARQRSRVVSLQPSPAMPLGDLVPP